jgi:threonyl-tRNA synthetase
MSKTTTPTLEEIRHSLAHILATAVLEMFPEAKLGVGPTIETGFYYDFELPRPLAPEDLPILEEKMRNLIKADLEFIGSEHKIKEAIDFYTAAKQPFKVELIQDIAKHGTTVFQEIAGRDDEDDSKGGDTVTFYKSGDFVDLCRGGHVKKTKEIDIQSFKLMSIAGAYWRGDEKRPMLQRIYGAAFKNKQQLKEYLHMLEEAKKRDHKKLGVELDLFTFSDMVGSGLPLWTPKGATMRFILDDFVWQLRKARGYERVEIPHITKQDLYETSGHWSKFENELFKIQTREGHSFAMKPMNCPHHTQIYKRKKWSYREMPQRYANTTMVYRDEQSGELAGLARTRSFTQDDAHVFCRSSQIKEECLKIWDIIEEFYGAIGLNTEARLSVHDPKNPEAVLGTPEIWEMAENQLLEITKDKGVDAPIQVGEAAFYGPKIDFMSKDSIGREWQVATIQLDVNMPERFDLSCVNEDGDDERIVMIHAAIMG